MKKLSQGEADRPESVRDVAAEVLEHVGELGLDEMKFSSVRSQCSDLIKDWDKWEKTHRTLLPDYLKTGNEKANEYAKRLRNTAEWGSSEPVAKGDSPADLFPEAVAETPVEASSAKPQTCSTLGITEVAIDTIRTEAPFNDLFAIDQEVQERIAADMKEHGYRPYEPIRTWNGVVLDGHTKLLAARKAGLNSVSVVRLNFASEAEAFDYAITAQTDRRNLRDGDYIRLVEKVDQRHKRGGKRGDGAMTSGEVVASAAVTAQRLGISQTRVENARAVLDAADEAIRKAVEDGTLSLHRAAIEARAAKKANHEDPRQILLNQEPEPPRISTVSDCGESGDREEPEPPEPDEAKPTATPAKTRKPVNADDRPEPSGAGREPDLHGILRALRAIMPLAGDDADLQGRFLADIEFVTELIDESGAVDSDGLAHGSISTNPYTKIGGLK